MAFVKKTESKDSQPRTDNRKIFIGRYGELLFFEQNILKSEEPSHNIISISGQAGVGKSALLKQFISKTRAADFKDYCLIAIVNERQVTPVSMMEKFADQLREKDFRLTKFEDALVHYKDALRTLQAEQENIQDALLRKTVPEVTGSIAKSVPLAGGALEEIAKTTTELVVDKIHYHHLLKNAKRLEDPIDDLTRAFVDDLNDLTSTQITRNTNRRQRRVILFFDTYEQLAAEATPWLLNYFLEAEISSYVVLVSAGCDPIERSSPDDPKGWLPYLDDNTIYSIYLNTFTEEETRKYLVARNITDSELISTIWQLSGGLPLFLSLLPSNPHVKVDPTAGVVANFLRGIPEQEQIKRRLALDAALFSKPFNRDDLKAFKYLPPNERSSIYRWLTGLTFVQSSLQDGHYSYHALIQQLFSRYLYQSSQDEYHATRRALANYYQKALKKIQMEGDKEVYRSATWLELTNAMIQQLFLLSDKASYIKAIEQVMTVHLKVGQEEETIRTLRELSKKEANIQISPHSRQIAKMLLQYIEADLTNNQGDLLTAVNYIIQEVAQESSFPRKLLVNLYIKRADICYLLKTYHQALADCNRAIELDPDNADAHYNRGRTYYAMGRLEDALADFDRAIELDPDYQHIGQEAKGEIFSSTQDYEKASQAFTKAIIADPTCHQGWESLINVYAILYVREKIPELLRSIPLSENFDALAYVNRATAMYDIGLEEEALIELGHSIELKPKEVNLYITRGELSRNLKRYNDGITDFTKAIDLSPNNATAIIGRGKAYLMMARYEEALSDFNTIIAYYSNAQTTSKVDREERYGME